MKLAIMQPYFFPYIGYFQLINAVDKFVFYDDVNFIKNGWINRNRILINGGPHFFTVHLKDASPYKLINETEFTDNRKKLLKTLELAYKRAPYFNSVMPFLAECLAFDTNKISELAQHSIIRTCKYLNIENEFEQSSLSYGDTKDLAKAERLQQICLINKSDNYFNLGGGQAIYSKQDFLKKEINLVLIESGIIHYRQFNNEFVPWLSIIDLLMFLDRENIRELLNNYTLI